MTKEERALLLKMGRKFLHCCGQDAYRRKEEISDFPKLADSLWRARMKDMAATEKLIAKIEKAQK